MRVALPKTQLRDVWDGQPSVCFDLVGISISVQRLGDSLSIGGLGVRRDYRILPLNGESQLSLVQALGEIFTLFQPSRQGFEVQELGWAFLEVFVCVINGYFI